MGIQCYISTTLPLKGVISSFEYGHACITPWVILVWFISGRNVVSYGQSTLEVEYSTVASLCQCGMLIDPNGDLLVADESEIRYSMSV